MTTPAQNQAPTTRAPQGTTTAVATRNERQIEYIPFGAKDQIKLNVSIIQRLCAVKTKSGKGCSEEDALKFMMMCQAQRLNPFAGDAFLIGYDSQGGPTFSLITAHQAFLKRAESSDDFLGMDSGVILLDEEKGEITERPGDFHLPEEKVVGGWAKVYHKKRPEHATYRRIRMARFNKGSGQWAVDAAGMIVKCAESDALRSTFPTLLGGLRIEGEVIDIDTTPQEPSKPVFQGRRQPRTIAEAQEQSRTAAQPEPQPGEPQGEPQVHQPETPEPENADPINEENPFAQIQERCKRDGVSEPQILAWAKTTKIAKADQTDLPQLANNKLVNILTNWKTLLPTWKAIKTEE